MPLGFRVYTDIRRPESALVQRFAGLEPADISDVMNMAGAMDTGIHPLYLPIKPFVGTAVTVSVPTGAFNVIKEGLQLCRPGDVLVVNAYGIPNTGLIGGNMCRAMLHRGCVGLIVDGTVRDVTEMRADAFPVHARGTANASGIKEDKGEVNVPIACGHVVVNPGDIVVANENGIAVVPPEWAEHVLEGVREFRAEHDAPDYQGAVRRGEIIGIARIESRLRELGCEFIDASR